MRALGRSGVHSFIAAVQESWSDIFFWTATMFIGVAALVPESARFGVFGLFGLEADRGVLIYLAAFFSICSIAARRREGETISALRRSVTALSADASDARRLLRDLLQNEVAQLAHSVGFSTNDRITVFAPRGKTFVIAARCAVTAGFQGPSVRAEYSAGEGCLGRAWSRGDEVIEEALPDPNIDFGGWQTAQRTRWGVSAAVCNRLRMRARFYAAFVVGASFTRPPLGVIVYESRDAYDATTGHPARLAPASLRAQKQPEIQRLLELLEIADRSSEVGRDQSVSA